MARQGCASVYINEGHLDGALGNIRNSLYYKEDESIVGIALLYAERVAKIHAFQDGNKRAGYAAMQLFLAKCGKGLDMTDHEQANFMVDLVNGTQSIERLRAELEISIYNLDGT